MGRYYAQQCVTIGHVSKIVSILLSKLSHCANNDTLLCYCNCKSPVRPSVIAAHLPFSMLASSDPVSSDVSCRYEKQRVILRADHPPLNCYLLFSGSVFVNIREWDETKGLSYFRTHSVLQRGSIFGVSTLLKIGSYSSTAMCQYWDNRLIY